MCVVSTAEGNNGRTTHVSREALRDECIRYRTVARRSELLDQVATEGSIQIPVTVRRSENRKICLSVAIVVCRCGKVCARSERCRIEARVLASQYKPEPGRRPKDRYIRFTVAGLIRLDRFVCRDPEGVYDSPISTAPLDPPLSIRRTKNSDVRPSVVVVITDHRDIPVRTKLLCSCSSARA